MFYLYVEKLSRVFDLGSWERAVPGRVCRLDVAVPKHSKAINSLKQTKAKTFKTYSSFTNRIILLEELMFVLNIPKHGPTGY